ncbi:hypothetical protein KUV62_22415 [Salipiger bermudensis]|nr:hypothetical protein [Salipiger bermudensis]MBY6006695.1 hypothetical protein [Salipiger bermudensis]
MRPRTPLIRVSGLNAAIANMAQTFERGKSDEVRASEAEIEKLHSKIG